MRAAVVRPICYRTHRTLMQRLRPLLLTALGCAVVALFVMGVVTVVARLRATEAQLDAAFLKGMAAGQQICGRN